MYGEWPEQLWDDLTGVFHVCVGVVLLYSGHLFVENPAMMLGKILEVSSVPGIVAVLGACVLPFAEGIVGLCLITGFLRTGAAWIASAMYWCFAAIHFSVALGPGNAQCGCFGRVIDFEVSWLSGVILFGVACMMTTLCVLRATSTDRFLKRK